jgi:hypothetical protein
MELPEQIDPARPWSPVEVQVLLQIAFQRLHESGEDEKKFSALAADKRVIYESRLAQFKLLAAIKGTVDLVDDETGEIQSVALGTVGEREAWAMRQTEGYRIEHLGAEAAASSAKQAVRITTAQMDTLRSLMATARESDGGKR